MAIMRWTLSSAAGFHCCVSLSQLFRDWIQPNPNWNLWSLKANWIFTPHSLFLQGVLSKWCKVNTEFCLLVRKLALYELLKPPVQDPPFSLPALESFCNAKRQLYTCIETAVCVSKLSCFHQLHLGMFVLNLAQEQLPTERRPRKQLVAQVKNFRNNLEVTDRKDTFHGLFMLAWGITRRG